MKHTASLKNLGRNYGAIINSLSEKNIIARTEKRKKKEFRPELAIKKPSLIKIEKNPLLEPGLIYYN